MREQPDRDFDGLMEDRPSSISSALWVFIRLIETIQRRCIEQLDRTRDPEDVLEILREAIHQLHAGGVSTDQLVERNRISKPLSEYRQYTQNVAALERANEQDLAVHPGEDIEYVVVDDEKSFRDRVEAPYSTGSRLRNI